MWWAALIAGITLVALAIVTLNLREVRRDLLLEQKKTRNLTRQLDRQQGIAALVEPLRALGEVAYNVLMLADDHRRILYINSAGRELFDLSEMELTSSRSSVIAVTRSHEIDDMITEVINQEELLVEQITLRGCTYRVRATRVEHRGHSYVSVAMEDVSELQRLGRARRDFVANISHELRTPITSIRLLVDTLQRGTLQDTDGQRNILSKIASETEVLHQMAQELLDLSMIESGRAEFMLRPEALHDIVDAAVTFFSERARRKNLTIVQDVPEDLIVLADREQFRRALSNLLHNAIKFTPAKGRITVKVSTDAEWATVSVTDTGSGISPLDRERIFERFYRGDLARHTEGTGLGLAIAKHIVKAHGGDIWAEEPERPPGAKVCFTIPLAD